MPLVRRRPCSIHSCEFGSECGSIRTPWAAVHWKSRVPDRDSSAGCPSLYPPFLKRRTACCWSSSGGSLRFATTRSPTSTRTDTSRYSSAMADVTPPKRSRRTAERTAKMILGSGRVVTDSDVLQMLQHWAFRKNRSRKNVLPLGAEYVESDMSKLIRHTMRASAGRNERHAATKHCIVRFTYGARQGTEHLT